MEFYIYVFFIQLSLLASLTIYFREKKELYLKLFPLFLLVSDVVEILANYLASHKGTNIVIYNWFMIVEFCFYMLTLMQIISNKRAKKVILVICILYLFFAVYNILFGPKDAFNARNYLVGALLIVAICIYYFLELFRLPHSVNLLRQPAFWICSGLLFFHACTFPVFGLVNFITQAPRIIIAHLRTILNILNVFLYSSFTIAFLCRIKIRKSTS